MRELFLKADDFRSLNLSASLLQVLQELKFAQMTPIQAESIPLILAGKDIVGHSQTGSGKTAAFLIPVLQKIKINLAQPQVLILCPTRELCEQVFKEARKFSKYMKDFRCISLSGGQPAAPQAEALRAGAHLVVGTPGRTLEHLQNDRLKTKALKILILDEADRLLEEGFADELKAILDFLPTARQTLFFSATFPLGIQELSQQHQKSAEHITVAKTEQNQTSITQYLYFAEKPEKIASLLKILEKHPSACTLIFCRTKVMVDEIAKLLATKKISSAALHADLKQVQRDQANAQFRSGKIQVLVATDVAARGLDIDRLELVINVDLPPSADIYIHRIGRTGRAGRKGTAVSIATEYERGLVTEIEAFTGVTMLRE